MRGSKTKTRHAGLRISSLVLLFFAMLGCDASKPPAVPSGTQPPISKKSSGRTPAASTADPAEFKKLLTPAQLALGDPITNHTGMALVPIPAGEFQMGSQDFFDDEKPPHQVTITKPFYVSVHEVTQRQYETVTKSRPWQGQSEVREGPDYPATYVDWDDAVEFCRKLSQQEGAEYRLPSEAEWEYACRAATTTAYGFGDDVSKLGQYAWYSENARKIGEVYAHAVGQKLPNAWGLYDTHGNVWEWCHDWSRRYEKEAIRDPTGPVRGATRVKRGGSFDDAAHAARSGLRASRTPDHRNQYIGFRVVRSYP